MLTKYIKHLQKKLILRHDGLPIFYIVYKPQKDGKNVISYATHPDIQKDEKLDVLLRCAADRVREYYKENPKLLEEIKEAINA